jgi:hypothetical protein
MFDADWPEHRLLQSALALALNATRDVANWRLDRELFGLFVMTQRFLLRSRR